ncbi:MAG: hypothetical protein Kow0031_09760 [Anaerolineae bacterium]
MTDHHSPFTIYHSQLLILLLAFALGLHALAGDSFWGDEILTASFAAQSPAEVIRWTAKDIHPPLYYLLAGAFTRLTASLSGVDAPGPASDWLWRFPSVAALLLAVAATMRLGAIFGRAAKLPARAVTTSAGLLLAVSPLALKYAQEARMHALFMLLAALSTLLLFGALERPGRWSRWLAYALALTAMLYTMYFGFLILAAHGVLTAFTIYDLRFTNYELRIAGARRIKPMIFGFAGAVAAAFVLYLPWWPVLFDILRRRAAVGAIEGGVGAPLDFISGVVAALGPLPPAAAWLFVALFAVGVIALARHHPPLAAFAGAWLLLPVALPVFLGDPRALQFRYAFVLPVYLPVIAVALWALAARLPASSQSQRRAAEYGVWLLATISLVGSIGVFQQTKPNWRQAAAFLSERVAPADIVLLGPLWDEGRFIGYYYRGSAPLLTPAAMVVNIQGRAEGLRQGNGRVWAVNRFAPAESPVYANHSFNGVVVSEPTLTVFEPELLQMAALDLAAQAVEAAYPWAAAAQAQGVLDPDPRTAQAAALRALGDAWLAAGQPQPAVAAYQRAVDIFPGWVSGFIALAEAQQAAGNLPEAARAYREAVQFNLDWQGEAAAQAAALVEAEQWAEAVAAYQKIVE